LVSSVTRDLAELVVHPQKPALGLTWANAHRGQFEGGSIKFLALAQSLFQSRASLQISLESMCVGAIALEKSPDQKNGL